MNKTAHTELHRLFLVERLPEPLTAASSHLQIFDTYIPHTRFRVRQMRDPLTNNWTRVLQQRFCATEGEHAVTKLVEMHLDDDEFAVFERMHGMETRKNRYFHEFDRAAVAFDVYLGGLRGLTTAKVGFDSREQMLAYEPAPFMIFEVTEEEFFDGPSLAGRSFSEVEAEVSRLGASIPPAIPEE
jgi:CYTH domain-containing protein